MSWRRINVVRLTVTVEFRVFFSFFLLFVVFVVVIIIVIVIFVFLINFSIVYRVSVSCNNTAKISYM